MYSQNTPFKMKKQKGGGTTKTCLPASKIKSMSSSQRQKLVKAKKSAGSEGKYRRSSKTNVKGENQMLTPPGPSPGANSLSRNLSKGSDIQDSN